MGFASPARLTLLAFAAAYVLLLIWRERRDRRMLSRIGEEKLLENLIDQASGRRSLKANLRLAALVALILAAARPQFGTRLVNISRQGGDIFVAVDVSASMLAEDVAPSRMEKARRSLGLLVQNLKGERVGIIAFAGDAFVACPLTLDVDAAGLFLESVSAGSSDSPGTALGKAVRLALKHFPEQSRARKTLVLLTDGEDTRESRPLEAAREAKKASVTIHTIGLGTPQGEVIRLRDESGTVTGYKKDEKGQTVLSRLDEATLIEMARISGGRYYRSSPDDAEITSLTRDLSSFGVEARSTRIHRVREERYQPLVLLALLIMIAEALIPRRRAHLRQVLRQLRSYRFRLPFKVGRDSTVLLAAGLAVALTAAPAGADYRAELKSGNRFCRKGDMEKARQAYFNAQSESPEAAYNVGNTYCYEGNFEEALKFYEQARQLCRRAPGGGNPRVRAAIEYNSGWALYRAGREAEAVEAFKEALRLTPDDEDAKYNIEWIGSPKQPRSRKPGQDGDGEKKESKLSREDAERVLEMIRDQERRMLGERRPDKRDQGKEAAGKDW